MRHAEPLFGRIEMVKLERRQASRVAAEPAASTSLGHEDFLDLAASTHDSLLATMPAAVIAAHLANVRHGAVSGTNEHDLRKSRRPGLA